MPKFISGLLGLLVNDALAFFYLLSPSRGMGYFYLNLIFENFSKCHWGEVFVPHVGRHFYHGSL
jgi:hypothetical protein